MKSIKIPARIDDPPHLLRWSIDELAPLLIGLLLGVAIGQVIICCCIGYALMRVYRKFLDNTPDGYLLHMLYAAGFLPAKGKSMLNPYVRRLFP